VVAATIRHELDERRLLVLKDVVAGGADSEKGCENIIAVDAKGGYTVAAHGASGHAVATKLLVRGRGYGKSIVAAHEKDGLGVGK
jgi:hypothetical protein